MLRCSRKFFKNGAEYGFTNRRRSSAKGDAHGLDLKFACTNLYFLNFKSSYRSPAYYYTFIAKCTFVEM